MRPPTVERYLRLGLHVGRHVEAAVDAYFGPAELAAAVAAEPPVAPDALVAEAQALLDELEDGWLRDQVAGLRAYVGMLAGEPRSYADEAAGCYGVRPTHTDEAVFAAAHDRLDELLPGEGPLADRYRRWEESMRVPAEHLEATMAALIEEARSWTRGLVELPDGEGVALEVVRDKPWLASCDYLGGLHSRIVVNLDLPLSAVELLVLAIHETYPGHHAERCCKEHVLVDGHGLLEEALVLSPTPQTVVAEGIAGLAPGMLLAGSAGPALAAIVREAGAELDLPRALAVRLAHEPCELAFVNAALLLHEDGASEADAQAYVERWGLEGPEWAAHVIRFVTEPSQRTHICTYSAGRDLCRAYVSREQGGLRRLLTEQVRVRDLLAASMGSA